MSGLFPQHGEILLYDNGTDKQFVSVVFKDETFWLTQSGMAELFDCSADNISLHLKNIYAAQRLPLEKPEFRVHGIGAKCGAALTITISTPSSP